MTGIGNDVEKLGVSDQYGVQNRYSIRNTEDLTTVTLMGGLRTPGPRAMSRQRDVLCLQMYPV